LSAAGILKGGRVARNSSTNGIAADHDTGPLVGSLLGSYLSSAAVRVSRSGGRLTTEPPTPSRYPPPTLQADCIGGPNLARCDEIRNGGDRSMKIIIPGSLALATNIAQPRTALAWATMVTRWWP